MKHYGKFLPDAGRPIIDQANDLERLYLRKQTLEQQLTDLKERIKREERDFTQYIKKEWSKEEIREAKEKAQQYLKNYNEEETDLFQNLDQLPEEVKAVVNEYSDREYLEYSELEIFLKRVEALGYTFEYGLESIPFNLTKIK